MTALKRQYFLLVLMPLLKKETDEPSGFPITQLKINIYFCI